MWMAVGGLNSCAYLDDAKHIAQRRATESERRYMYARITQLSSVSDRNIHSNMSTTDQLVVLKWD